MSKNLYLILGVSPDADISQIRKAYKKKAKCHHPDAATGSNERFTEVQEAYDTLADKESRYQYDQQRKAVPSKGTISQKTIKTCAAEELSPVQEPFAPQGFRCGRVPPGDMTVFRQKFDRFSNLRDAATSAFGVPQGQFSSPKRINITLILTHSEAARGGQTTVRLPATMPCRTCSGDGFVGMRPCLDCLGRGNISGQRNYIIHIPAGVRNGSQARLLLSDAGRDNRELVIGIFLKD